MKRLLWILCLLFSSFVRAEGEIPLPQVEILPNGLEVVWFNDPQIPLVDFTWVVKAGFRDDAPGKSGTAALLIALLDRGGGGLGPYEMAKSIESLGVSRLLSVEDDQIALQLHGLASDAGRMLELLSKIALAPDLKEQEYLREKKHISERWQHVDDFSDAAATLVQHRVLAAGTSYGRGGFLSLKEFEKITRSDLVAFHKKYFTPENSILMVSGKFNQAELREKILGFSTWPGHGVPKRAYKNYTDHRLVFKGQPAFLLERAGATQAQLRLSFRIPTMSSQSYYPLVVANAIAGEYFNSRLISLVRDKLGLTYGIESSLSFARDFGEFAVNTSSKNENVSFLLQKTLEVLEGLKNDPVTAEELQGAKNYVIGNFSVNHASLAAISTRWLIGHLLGMETDFVKEFSNRIQAVTLAEVQKSIQENFKLDHRVIVILGDAAAIRTSLISPKKKTGSQSRKYLDAKQLKQVSVKDLR